jgi:geranylgeranyl diphosphate synthase, type II
MLSALQKFAAQNPFPSEPPGLYEPCDYIMALGGKRMRPVALLYGYQLFRDDTERALPAAWAVELFHNFTLMHDDIMDAAPLRRGQPTVHTRWNVTTGILSGDVMLIKAYEMLIRGAAPDTAVALLHTFNRVATGVCEGQQLDVNFETRNDVTLPEYIKMIELKTAVLLGGALEMGALAAGAPAADAERLYHFGRLAGIAFQIQDDLLDTYGDPEKFGKQPGGDIVQNKKTFLTLKTFEVATPGDRAALHQWMQTGSDRPEEKITAVRAIYDRNDIPALVAAEKQYFHDAAFRCLEEVAVPDARKRALRELMEGLFVREY